MNVVHYVRGLATNDGGPSRSVPRLNDYLARAGMSVVLAYSRGGDDLTQEVRDAEANGVRVVRLDRTSDGQRLLTQANVVHLHGLWTLDVHDICSHARRAKRPVVFSPRGMLEPWALEHHGVRKRVAWFAYQRRDLLHAARIHATSRMECEHLVALGLPVGVTVIPNGTDVPPFFEGPRERRILFLSRIHRKKGLTLLVEAVARLRADLERTNWSVIIAGPDEDGSAASLRKAVEQKGLDGLVSFAGPVDGDEKWRLMQTSSVFVLPTYSENFGLVVAEALAAGTPVITTTGAPWQELVTERCGWWVAPDADAITDALSSAIATTDSELRTMGLRGRALVASRYSWAAVAQQFKELYGSVCQST